MKELNRKPLSHKPAHFVDSFDLVITIQPTCRCGALVDLLCVLVDYVP
jgi:hypothetical protein